ncbi:MAG TPA: hypothetical protein VEM39_01545, partial [Myxococcaceae bacterium]|nr:hypothetical protein [Myxococcaceae bacterium]
MVGDFPNASSGQLERARRLEREGRSEDAARLYEQHDTSAVGAGLVAGTPEYIAPEQIREITSVGPSADLYALGAVAYEMFTATPPFRE